MVRSRSLPASKSTPDLFSFRATGAGENKLDRFPAPLFQQLMHDFQQGGDFLDLINHDPLLFRIPCQEISQSLRT